MAGYSGTPLAKKLGIKDGFRLFTRNAPDHYQSLIQPIPEDVIISGHTDGDTAEDFDMIHFFTKSETELAKLLPDYMNRITQNGMIWISWPKKASKVPTDVTEDVVRKIALPLGLVDVKVCAVDEVWSGLKLVIRKENRKKAGS